MSWLALIPPKVTFVVWLRLTPVTVTTVPSAIAQLGAVLIHLEVFHHPDIAAKMPRLNRKVAPVGRGYR